MTPVEVQFSESCVLAKAGANVVDFLVAQPVETEIQSLEARVHGQQLPDFVSVEYAIAAQVQMRQVLLRVVAAAVVVLASHDRIDDGPYPRRTNAVPPQIQAFQIRILIHPLGQFNSTGIPKDSQAQRFQVVPSEQERHCLGKQVQRIPQVKVQMSHRRWQGGDCRENRL